MTTTRADRAADQEAVALHLIDAVRQRFAGEDAHMARAVGWEPNERIVIGVLDPREPTLPAPVHPDLPEEPGVPVDTLPPSELGVTVWVELPAGATHACFDVNLNFSVYVPEYPTWAEQHAWMTGHAGGGGNMSDARSDDDDLAVGDDTITDPPEEAVPTQREDDGGGGDSAQNTADQSLETEVAVAQGEGTRDGGRRGGQQSIRFAPVFARREVTAVVSLDVPLAGGTITDMGVGQENLTDAITSSPHRLAYVLRGRSRTGISRVAFDAGESAYEAEILDRRTTDLPPLPSVEFLASSTPDPRGGWRINLTLANTAVSASRRDRPSQTIYNAHFAARLREGRYRNFGYRLSDRDWRAEPEVFAHGRFCVGEVDGNVVRTNTWPIYRDLVFESRPELQPGFRELVDNPLSVLGRIADQMDSFANAWRALIAEKSLDFDRVAACERDLAVFVDESQRFRRGIALLQRDPQLLAAFISTNRAFRMLNTPNALHPNPDAVRGTPQITSWRLFQIVFIVLGLSALAAREQPGSELQKELDYADVLWFPTGGGKSEAFLGLIAVALFYDRLRQKHSGTSAVLRFPLRMLSVQQLDRVLRLITSCEHVRREHLPHLGEPFELGYFVGRMNTPNTLTNSNDDRWGDIRQMARWTHEQRRKNVVITTCPYCRSTEIELVADADRIRLDHRCCECGSRMPVVVSDDEIYRTLPSIVVATVDKLATIGFQPHLSHLTHGPAFRCPDHGFVTFSTRRADRRRCLAREFCHLDPDDWVSVHPYDPAPALVVQDELHLLAENLALRVNVG